MDLVQLALLYEQVNPFVVKRRRTTAAARLLWAVVSLEGGTHDVRTNEP
jgi:hypothetical protein